MWFMYILSWIAFFVQVSFVTLAIAAGLYYLADLVEEYTVVTAKIIKAFILINTVTYVGLFVFEDLSTSMIVCGLLANLDYFVQMNTFPDVVLSSPIFITSIVLLVVNHYLAFSFFTSIWYPFTEVLAYFTICLWLVPFALFVSLSANENVLPVLTTEKQPLIDHENDLVSNYFRKKGRKYGLLTLLKYAQESVLPERVKKHF